MCMCVLWRSDRGPGLSCVHRHMSHTFTHPDQNRAVYISTMEQALLLEEALQREGKRLAERVRQFLCLCVSTDH